MLRRIEPEESPATLAAATGGARASEPVVPAVAEADFETTGLPHDHPRWVRDADIDRKRLFYPRHGLKRIA